MPSHIKQVWSRHYLNWALKVSIRERKGLSSWVYDDSITLISKLNSYHKKRKLQANRTKEHRCKHPQHNLSKLKPEIHQKNHLPWSTGIYPKNERIFQYPHINQYDTAHKKMKDHIIISVQRKHMTRYKNHSWANTQQTR